MMMMMMIVRDRPDAIGEGGQMNLHGPTRWFQGHTFVPMAQMAERLQPSHQPNQQQQQQSQQKLTSGGAGGEEGGAHGSSSSSGFTLPRWFLVTLPMVLFGVMSFCFTLLLVIVLYRFVLKPRLIRRHLKQD